MPRKKTRSKKSVVPVFLLAPPAVYAAYVLALFAMDNFRGDGLMLHQFLYESRRALAWRILSDAGRALPAFYAAGLLVWLELFLLSRFLKWRGILPGAVAGALTGAALAVLCIASSVRILVPYAVSGLLMAMVLAWAIRRAGLQARG